MSSKSKQTEKPYALMLCQKIDDQEYKPIAFKPITKARMKKEMRKFDAHDRVSAYARTPKSEGSEDGNSANG